jgi:hypothetical protein
MADMLLESVPAEGFPAARGGFLDDVDRRVAAVRSEPSQVTSAIVGFGSPEEVDAARWAAAGELSEELLQRADASLTGSDQASP